MYLLHGMIVSPIISTVTFTLTTVWLSVSLGGLTYWFWGVVHPAWATDGEWGQYVAAALPWLFGGWSSWAVEVVLYLIAGVVFAITLPWAMGGFARLHHAIARGMLGRWPSATISPPRCGPKRPRAARPCRPRSAALRRLERDIHDGPQQRLVRLQLDLAALERRAARATRMPQPSSPGRRRCTPSGARRAARALERVSRRRCCRIADSPPRSAAVAAGSALPVGVDIDPAVDAAVSPEVARTVYFVVAELLTNAVKHSGASAATLKASLRPAVGESPPMLDLWVVDNGRGGADFRPGHGLEGLRDRVAGLRGVLVVDSAAGRPTTVGAHIPLAVDGVVRPRLSWAHERPRSEACRRSRCGSSSSRTRCCCARVSCGSSTRPATSRPGVGRRGRHRRARAAKRGRMSRSSTCGCRRPSATRASARRCGCARSCPASASWSSASTSRASTPASCSPRGDGGVGYLLKDRVTSLEEFTDAVRRVHERGTVLDPLVVRGLLAARPDPLAALTPRERDVLELMAEGRSNASIAERLFIGVGAVEKNISAIFAKLGLEESGTEHRRVLAVLAWLQRD